VANYPSKLLLFGEHTVLSGSQALAMPLPLFSGSWHHSSGVSKKKQLDLNNLNEYLKKLVEKGELSLDTEGVARELDKGLYFKSNIPNGYGVGSSGALIAAIYRVFGINRKMRGRLTHEDLPDLKALLGKMESYFHGNSSGFDPLISYLNKPVLIKKNRDLEMLSHVDFLNNSTISLFLLDTKMPRKAESFIRIFQEKNNTPLYKPLIEHELVPYVDDAIAAFLQNIPDILFESVHHISHWQYRYFPESIPDSFKNIWLEGLSNDIYKLKLCGAGGGGFILGFSKNIVLTKNILDKNGLDIIVLNE
jgi:mevalonate kinase